MNIEESRSQQIALISVLLMLGLLGWLLANPAKADQNAMVRWLGIPAFWDDREGVAIFGNKVLDKDQLSPLRADDIEIGLRSDGVVVWRKKGSQ